MRRREWNGRSTPESRSRECRAGQADIRAQVARVFRDLGNPEPPLDLEAVIDLLKLDFKYYSSTDLSLFDEIGHRVKVAGKLVVSQPGRILDVILKAKLSALWLPDGRRILMDENVPTPKQRHIQAHEIIHSIALRESYMSLCVQLDQKLANALMGHPKFFDDLASAHRPIQQFEHPPPGGAPVTRCFAAVDLGRSRSGKLFHDLSHAIAWSGPVRQARSGPARVAPPQF